MPTEAERNIELVRAGVDAFTRGDIDAVLAIMDPDVEVFTPPGLANAGTYHGHEGFLHWTAQWLEAWEGFSIELEEIEAVGDAHVIAQIHQRARGRGSGVEVEMRIVYMFEARNGKAVRFHLYPDRDSALAAVRHRSADRTRGRYAPPDPISGDPRLPGRADRI
jgi:ketosteroid isomerase-like protein